MPFPIMDPDRSIQNELPKLRALDVSALGLQSSNAREYEVVQCAGCGFCVLPPGEKRGGTIRRQLRVCFWHVSGLGLQGWLGG